MKKIFCGILVVGLLMIISCRKTEPTGLPSQTWTFKSLTYNTVECFEDTTHYNLDLSANNGSTNDSNSYCSVTCFFHGNALPTSNGNYTVALVNEPTDSITPTQVTFRLVLGGALNNYMSTGGNGHQTVNVAVNNGKLTITGTGIEMAHYNSGFITDSAALSFNITQTQ
jgi:hypothetical protein